MTHRPNGSCLNRLAVCVALFPSSLLLFSTLNWDVIDFSGSMTQGFRTLVPPSSRGLLQLAFFIRLNIIMPNLSLVLLTAYASYAKAKFIRKTQQVTATQEQFLLTLLQAHQQTVVGRSLGLSTIKTVDQFRSQVPVLPYSSYEPYTDRVAQGEKNVLTADPVVYINLTSGSTGKKKQVPVTRRFQRTIRRAELASLGFSLEALTRQHRQFGKLLVTNAATLQGVTSGGVEYGPVSAGSVRRGKLLFEQAFALPFNALEISDSLARHYVCLLFALRNPDVRGMAGNFPMLILRTCGYLEQYADELIYDLANGTIADWLLLDPELRVRLERRCSPLPMRAMQLREILKAEGRLTPILAWPSLCVVCTARGGTSDFYFERFPDYFGDTPVFGGVYGTAEGNFSVYNEFNTDGGILAIESGFYEFIPRDQWEVEHPKTLLPTEVTVGELYRILVTSYSGFYRYDIGDVIEVVGFYQQAPLIVFRYRRGGLLSSTTEKTTEFHATQVMQALQQEFDVRLEDFCLTLSEHEFPSPYLVNIELAAGQTLANPQAFLHRFDDWMAEVNNPYGTARLGQVPPPRLRLLQSGSFAMVRQRQVERGMSDSQIKFPHISEDRQFLTGIEVDREVEYAAEGSSNPLGAMPV